MCLRTFDLLGRALNVDVSLLLTDDDVREMITAVDKVAGGVLQPWRRHGRLGE
jgi:hypothetical protein